MQSFRLAIALTDRFLTLRTFKALPAEAGDSAPGPDRLPYRAWLLPLPNPRELPNSGNSGRSERACEDFNLWLR
eukprot:6315481-Pyramimonas_sp.AAC.1